MSEKTVTLEVRDGVGHLTLNRPNNANAVNDDFGKDILDCAIRAAEDPAIRAILLSGAGKMFSAGGDLKEFVEKKEGLPAFTRHVTTHLHAGISHLMRADAPIVAAVQGFAAGAGMSLSLVADLVVIGESTRFTMAYTRAGLSPDGSATYFLPRIVGLRRALDLTLTNRVVGAKEALEIGLATRIVPDADIHKEALALALELAQGATRAFGAAKRLLHSSLVETLETQMQLESLSIAEIAKTKDATEGLRAFNEKRAPRFRGE